MSETAGSKWLR